MSKYRMTVVVEAIQFTGDNALTIGKWMHACYVRAGVDGDRLIIPTVQGDETVVLGDFVIKGVKGGFSVCRPDIFAATHELVED